MGGMDAFEVGDEITPTEAELEAFPERFRELRDSDESTSEAPFDPSDMTVDEVEEALNGEEYGSEALDELEETESSNDDRDGVHDAIAEHRS